MSPHRLPRALTACAVLVAALVLLPLALTVSHAIDFGIAATWRLVWRPVVARLTGNTVLIVCATTACCSVLGTATAWCVERTRLPGQRLFAVLCVIPLAIPPFITSYAWVSLSDALQGFYGALLVLTTAYAPLVFLPVSAALRGMDPAQEEAARSLGLGSWACFWRVTLPQLRPAMLGGMLLVALGTLSEFGAFMLMHFHTLTTEIYAEYRAGFDSSGAAALAILLMLAGLLMLAIERRLNGEASYERRDRGARRKVERLALGGYRWPVAGLFLLQCLVTLAVPLGTIAYWIGRHGEAAITPAEVSADALIGATLCSVELGLSGAALTTLLALPLSYLAARYRGRLSRQLERIVYLAQSVPGIVIALGLVTLSLHLIPPLYQSTLLLVIAYAILFLPLAMVSVTSAFLQAESRLEELARSLGLRWWQAWWRVVLPLAAPGLGAAATLVFISVTTELTATLLLSPIGTDTLATQIWADTSALAFAAAAPYAAILTGLSMASTWLLMTLLGRAAFRSTETVT